jgi:hypothetical protein
MTDLKNSLTDQLTSLFLLHHTLSVYALVIHMTDTEAEGSGWDCSGFLLWTLVGTQAEIYSAER